MRLTTRGRYAVTAMLDLALQPDSQPVSLSEIAQRQPISVAYLEQLFAKLKRHGLVTSLRGANGGYRLGRSPDQIAVLDIIEAVNESVDTRRCEGRGDCHHGSKCLTHELWHDLSEQISGYLRQVTLASVIERRSSLVPADAEPVAIRPRSSVSEAHSLENFLQ